MFAFLPKPKINQETDFLGTISVPCRVPGDQRRRTAAVAELELLNRRQKRFHDAARKAQRRVPVGFVPVGLVLLEMPDPRERVERCHKGLSVVYFVLQSKSGSPGFLFKFFLRPSFGA